MFALTDVRARAKLRNSSVHLWERKYMIQNHRTEYNTNKTVTVLALFELLLLPFEKQRRGEEVRR